MGSPSNEFLAFATGANANVEDQATWEQDPTVANGFYGGIAPSNKFNKAWRQAGFPGASLSQWVFEQLQTVDVPDDGNVQNWVNNFDAALLQRIQGQSRLRLTTPLNLYVTNSGSDNNDGLSNSTALATPQGAWNRIINKYDVGGQSITVNMANGVYPPFVASGSPVGSANNQGVEFLGNTSNPALVSITASGNNSVTVNENAVVVLNGIHVQAVGNPTLNTGIGIVTNLNGQCYFENCDFGACSTGHMWCFTGGLIYGLPGSSYSISGGSGYHAAVTNASNLSLNSMTCTIAGNPTFSQAFFEATSGGNLQAELMTFGGSALGQRWLATSFGVIGIGGTNPNTYIPGSIAGVTSGGIVQ